MVFALLSCSNQPIAQKYFDRQIGSYKLDLKRTDLGSYKKDSVKYKNLQITFYKDSTFVLSQAVPFIFEETGRWVADGGDIDSWNWLSYKSWLKKNEEILNKGNQFTHVYKNQTDSIFCINAATPKEGQDFIQEIYFYKLGR